MSQQVITDQPLELVPCLTATVAGDGLKTLCLCPDGEVKSKKGTFIVDAESARMVVEAFEEHGTDLPIDYEHQTLGGEFSSPTGRAPAAGWIKKLWYEADRGLLSLVGWNESARATIRAGEYCYLSPVLSIGPVDRRVVALHSAALTNKPAIPRVEKIAAKDTDVTLDDREIAMGEDDPTKEGDGENVTPEDLLRTIKGVLGLDKPMTATEILQAVLAKLQEGNSEEVTQPNQEGGGPDMALQLGQILESLGITDTGGGSIDAVITAILAAIRELKGGAEVAASVREKLDLAADANRDEVVLAMRLSESRQETAEADREAKAMVDGYVEVGKLNPNDTEGVAAAMSLARENPERLEALMANAADLRPPQGKTTPPDPATTRRDQAIRMTVGAFKADPVLQQQTTLDAAVDLVLRDNGLPKLADNELARFV